MPIIPAAWEAETGGSMFEASLNKFINTLSELVEYLPGKCEARSSNPNTTKINK
jgi:hypothetical protein